MSSAASSRRFARLGLADLLLLGEGLATLTLASAAIRLLPFRNVAAMASRRAAGTKPDSLTVRRVRWVVWAWARRVPWRSVCFQKGLAVQMMLRRRGIGSALHYGVRKDGGEGLSAHVWVTLDGEPVIGGEEAARFACVAVYPELG